MLTAKISATTSILTLLFHLLQQNELSFKSPEKYEIKTQSGEKPNCNLQLRRTYWKWNRKVKYGQFRTILDSDNELLEDEPLSPIKFGLQRSPLKEKCYLLCG